jgi:hypothetical protein
MRLQIILGSFYSFPSHRKVLKLQAPQVEDLCEGNDIGKPMPIDDIEPETFQLMIGAVYGKNINAWEWKNQSEYLLDPEKHSTSILRAAAKYGLDTLKSEAESQTRSRKCDRYLLRRWQQFASSEERYNEVHCRKLRGSSIL